MRLQILRTALYLPPTVQTAAELAPLIGRSERWIVERTGVLERRVSTEPMHELAARVLTQVLGDGPLPDLLINASMTPVQLIPDSSVFIQRSMKWQEIPSFSIHATCMSFMLALHNAAALLHAGAYDRVAVVSAEQASLSRDWGHPESAALIGDGAAAVILQRTPEGEGSELLAWSQSTWPQGADLAEIRGGGTRLHPNDPATVPADNLFRMRGTRIYKMAVQRVVDLANELVAQAGISWDDIDVVVPHQASGPGVMATSKFLPVSRD
ncbi:MAG: 3-oxoacyl-[acyl-carrier-protein] synthase-3, partial [Kiritimatiellia bacterium]